MNLLKSSLAGPQLATGRDYTCGTLKCPTFFIIKERLNFETLAISISGRALHDEKSIMNGE